MRKNYKEPNDIVDCGDYYEIILCDIWCNERARTKIDKDDLEKVKKYIWSLGSTGYAHNSKILLHQLILGKKNGFISDHINHDRLDNRKKNLRLVTYQQNNWNIKAVGVYKPKDCVNWYAKIMINKKNINLGCFKTKKEAVEARRTAELKYHKEYAYGNINKHD